MNPMSKPPAAYRIDELTTEVMAAELHLTYFATRHGKDSIEYQNSLRSFATAWHLLKQSRLNEEFCKEVVLAAV